MNAKILLVDDDLDIRETFGEILREAGYDVTTAEHGAEALDALRAGAKPSVILLDLMMPIMDGWAFRAEQRRFDECRSIPVVILTAAGESARLQSLDARAVIHKPFHLDAALRVIEEVVLSSAA